MKNQEKFQNLSLFLALCKINYWAKNHKKKTDECDEELPVVDGGKLRTVEQHRTVLSSTISHGFYVKVFWSKSYKLIFSL